MTCKYSNMWPKRVALAFSSALIFLGCAPEHTTVDGQANSDKALKAVASNFKSINEVIFQPLCLRCHSGPKAPHKIDLSSYESMMDNNLFPPLIVKGKPDSSSIYESIKSGKMPKNGRPLPPEAIQAVRDWIAAGALKDEDSDGGGDDGGGEPPDDPPQEPPDHPQERETESFFRTTQIFENEISQKLSIQCNNGIEDPSISFRMSSSSFKVFNC